MGELGRRAPPARAGAHEHDGTPNVDPGAGQHGVVVGPAPPGVHERSADVAVAAAGLERQSVAVARHPAVGQIEHHRKRGRPAAVPRVCGRRFVVWGCQFEPQGSRRIDRRSKRLQFGIEAGRAQPVTQPDCECVIAPRAGRVRPSGDHGDGFERALGARDIDEERFASAFAFAFGAAVAGQRRAGSGGAGRRENGNGNGDPQRSHVRAAFGPSPQRSRRPARR